MAQPTTYNRQFNFQNYQASSPSDPLPGDEVDNEYNALKQTLDEILNNLALIQRDDTAIASNSVGYDQLKTEVNIGINPPTTWETDTNYVIRDSVFRASKFYIANESHISDVFADDLAAGKWDLIADFTGITTVLSNDPDPTLSADLDLDGNGIVFPGVTITDTTGDSATIVTGSAGANGRVVSWDANGNAVDSGIPAANVVVDADLSGAIANMLETGDIGVTVQAYDADTLKGDVEDQQITGGGRIADKDLGTVTSGTLTPDPGDRASQKYTNNGAHTLAPGSNKGMYWLDITNGASAGAITTSGWGLVIGAFTTTNAHKFSCVCRISDLGSVLQILPWQ